MADGPSNDEFAYSRFVRLVNILRHVVPLSWRARLRQQLFSIHPLTIVRPSGIRLRIADNTDWIHYTEIFRKGEYDSAIEHAIAASDGAQPLSIVDLGANVGFFTLRAVELIRACRPDNSAIRISAFEASQRNADEFQARVLADNDLAAHARIVRGLVGNTSGTALFHEATSHGDNSVFRRSGSGEEGTAIEYVDVSRQLADEPIIHLLKCDIEGAELQFIRNFSDVLRKTRVAVFELHADLCDEDECIRLLLAGGFPQQAVIRRAGPYSLQCVWR